MAEVTKLEDVIVQVKNYKKQAVDIAKGLKEIKDLQADVKKSINPAESTASLASVMEKFIIVEQACYDISIIKMEARFLLDGLTDEPRFAILRKEIRALLTVSGDCQIMAKNRYDFLATLLSGVRSINSNFRKFSGGMDHNDDPRKDKA